MDYVEEVRNVQADIDLAEGLLAELRHRRSLLLGAALDDKAAEVSRMELAVAADITLNRMYIVADRGGISPASQQLERISWPEVLHLTTEEAGRIVDHVAKPGPWHAFRLGRDEALFDL